MKLGRFFDFFKAPAHSFFQHVAGKRRPEGRPDRFFSYLLSDLQNLPFGVFVVEFDLHDIGCGEEGM